MSGQDSRLGRVEALMTPGEVARILHVTPTTVTRWARAGRIRSVVTPGGHRRFVAADVRALLNGGEGK